MRHAALALAIALAACADPGAQHSVEAQPGSDAKAAIDNGCGAFADVSGEHWAFPAIEAGARDGLWSGCADSPRRFCPDQGASRAMAAVILGKSAGVPTSAATGQVFSDVPASHWAAPMIEAMHREGLIAGCSDRRFCPDDGLTRAQLAALVVAAAGFDPVPDAGAFEDVYDGHWAADWIEAARVHGIMSGCTGSAFCPDDKATRAQLAAVTVGAFSVERAERCEQPDPPAPPSTGGAGEVPYFYQYANRLYPGASCQNTSISMVLASIGWRGRPDDITGEFGKDYAQSPAGLADVFNTLSARAGLGKRITPITDGTLSGLRAELDAGNPTIVHGYFTGYGHVVVVVGHDAGGYYVNDPAGTWNQSFKGGYPHGWEPTAGHAIYYRKDAFERAIATDGWSSLPLWYHQLR